MCVCVCVCVSDHVFLQILYSYSDELAGAREILQNIICRRLYKCVGEIRPTTHVDVSQVSTHTHKLTELDRRAQALF